MPASSFIFEGFLPKKKIDREKILLEISTNRKTTILFESPHRLNKLLKELKNFCGEDREIHISRELTKKFEENFSLKIQEALKLFDEKKVVGEITIVIRGVSNEKESEFNSAYLKKELHDLINAGLTLSSAASYLAKKENLTKSKIYNLY